MANLTKIEDLLTADILYAFDTKPKATKLDASWQRRSGTYTVLGKDYGVNPFGTYAAPMAVRKLQWTFRVTVPATGDTQTALDLAAASVNRAMAKRRQHRLVRSYATKEQVVTAQVIDCQDVTTAADNWRHRDFTVTWELLAPWRDRLARGPHRVGDTVGVAMGVTPLVMGAGAIALTQTTQTFAIIADGTDGLPAPTVDDTGLIIIIQGPFGGTQGFTLSNGSNGAVLQDTTGQFVNTYLQYTQPLATGDTLTLDCGALAATTHNAGDVWNLLVVPDYQPHWQIVVAGIVNSFTLAGVGTAPAVNAATSQITLAWNGLYQ